MPAPVMSQSRNPGKGAKRTQDHQQPPAKRAKLSKSQSTPPAKGLAAVVLPRSGEAKKVLQAASNGFKDDIRLHKVDESSATIANGPAVQDVDMEDDDLRPEEDEDDSSEAEEDSEYDSEDDSDESDAVNGETENTREKASKNASKTNGVAYTGDDDANDDDKEDDQEQEDQAPSFGELLLASTTDPIDVEAALLTNPTTNGALTTTPQQPEARALSIPAGASLTTLLTQALRTHDKDLLETCLQTGSLDTIRSTIERLDPTLATALLHRVAERLHKRPGRAASLMVWVQWTLVAHGGYLVSQPSVVRKVGGLYGVVSERARSLPWLLQLKGKLDMLAAQLEVRRNVERPPEVGATDDDVMIHVEGVDEGDEVVEREAGVRRGKPGKPTLARGRGADLDDDEGDEEDEDDDLADEDADDGLEMPMGAFDDDEDEDEQDSDDEELIDDEAEETDRDTGDERSEVESEEDDEGESIDESEEESDDDDEISAVRRSTAAQRPSKKAF